jgi:short-subunit dehydrogenase
VNSSTRGTALITGASRGIGAVYANRLVRRGYEVARSEAQLKGLANSLHSEIGRRITPVRRISPSERMRSRPANCWRTAPRSAC